MLKQRKRDLSAVTQKSLSDLNQVVASVYKPDRSLSNILLEVVGVTVVLIGPYALAALIGG